MNDRRSSRGLPPPASDSSARYSRVGMRRTASVLSFFSRGSRITWCIVSLVIIFAITQFITFSSHADPKGNSPVQHQKNVHHQENPPVVSPSAVEIHHPPNQFTQPIQIQTKDGIREEEVEFPTPKDIDPYTGLLVSDFNTVQGVFYGHPYQQPYHGYDPLTEFKPLFYPPASPEYENIMREVFLGTTFVGTWTLTHRQLCDLEMILNGGFSPLRGFMNEKTYNSVVKEMRLAPLEEEETEFPYVVPGSVPGLDGNYRAVLFPMPITLDIPKSLAEEIKNEGDRVLLKDEEGNALAVLTVQGRPWIPDKLVEAQYVFGTTDTAHPGVDYLLNHAHDYYVGGSIEGVQMPVHYDFEDVRLSPKMLRDTFKQNGWKRIVAFQTRNPMHMAHIELVKMAAAETSAAVLIHPSVGMTKPGDIQYGVRVACYKAVLSSGRHFSPYTSILSLLPIAMRMGGPREALWHAIVRKNYGVTHFIIGRDHAGVSDRSGKGYYEPYAAQELVKFHEFELGIKIQTYKEFEYVPELDRYLPADKIPEGMETKVCCSSC